MIIGDKMKSMVNNSELKDIYLSRPFSTRNADEYDLENILDLFIDPTDGLVGPFDFSNSIVKGKMGSGKTMYLRANYAYYLYTVVPCLLDESDIMLMYGKEASNRKQEIDRQHYTIPNQRPKDKHCGKI